MKAMERARRAIANAKSRLKDHLGPIKIGEGEGKAWPRSERQLNRYIRDRIKNGNLSYDECPKTMAEIAAAAFNYAGVSMGASGFQASAAGLRFLRISRSMGDAPFGILEASRLLYPQMNLRREADEMMDKWLRDWAWKRCEELIAEDDKRISESGGDFVFGDCAAPQVRAHWIAIVETYKPEETPTT